MNPDNPARKTPQTDSIRAIEEVLEDIESNLERIAYGLDRNLERIATCLERTEMDWRKWSDVK